MARRAKIRPLAARRMLTLFLLVGLLASVPVTRGDAARSAGAQQNRLVVGALLDLSRGWTSLGRASRVPLGLAAADANVTLARRGSPLRVELRSVDSEGEPPVALRQLRRLAAAGVHVVVGPQKSSEVAAVRRAATKLGVVIISQGSKAHSLAVAGDRQRVGKGWGGKQAG